MPAAAPTAAPAARTGWLFEVLAVAALLWTGFRLDLVPGGQVGVDVLLAGAGWWFGREVGRRRAAKPALVGGFAALWPPILAAIALAVVWVLTTDGIAGDRLVRGEALGLLGGYGNWHQIAWGPSEIVGPRLTTALASAWPVSVAVQAAIAWALLALGCRRWQRRTGAPRDSAAVVGAALVLALWGSGLFAGAAGITDQAILLSTPTRGVSFLLGAALGASRADGTSAAIERRAQPLILVPVAILLVSAVVADPGSTWWRYGGSSISAVLAVGLVAAAVAHGTSGPITARGDRPILWLGLVAFVVVHGPVLAIVDIEGGAVITAVAAIGGVIASILLAAELGLLEVTRSRTPASVERRRVLGPVVALVLVVALFSATGAFAWASPQPIDDAAPPRPVRSPGSTFGADA